MIAKAAMTFGRPRAVADPNLPWRTALKNLAMHATDSPAVLGNSWLYRALMRTGARAAQDRKNY